MRDFGPEAVISDKCLQALVRAAECHDLSYQQIIKATQSAFDTRTSGAVQMPGRSKVAKMVPKDIHVALAALGHEEATKQVCHFQVYVQCASHCQQPHYRIRANTGLFL